MKIKYGIMAQKNKKVQETSQEKKRLNILTMQFNL